MLSPWGQEKLADAKRKITNYQPVLDIFSSKKLLATRGIATFGARTLLVAPGIATSNKIAFIDCGSGPKPSQALPSMSVSGGQLTEHLAAGSPRCTAVHSFS